MTGKAWLFVLLIPGILLAGVIIGFMLPRVSTFDGVASSSLTSAPAGVSVELVDSAVKLFGIVGEHAQVVKYTGGDVSFWIEIESNGKKEIPFDDRGESNTHAFPPGPNETIQGYFIWVRGKPDSEGKELWSIGWQRAIVAAKASGVEVSMPLVQASISKTADNPPSLNFTSNAPVQVWNPQTDPLRSFFAKSAISNPIPTDKAVCVYEVTEEWAPTISGATSAPKDANEIKNELSRVINRKGQGNHTIRVMCKTASASPKTGEKAADAKE